MIFEQKFKMTLEDIDKNGFITNKAILRCFENTATYHSDSIGGGIKSVEETGLTWIVLDWSVKVLKRAKYGTKLKVRTWSRGYIKFFAYRDYELIDENNEVIAIGTSRWILRDIYKHKMVFLNDEYLSGYGSEDRTVLPGEEFSKMEVPPEFSNEIEYTIMRRDIDFNRHMHNLYHFDLAYEALPNVIYDEGLFNNFRITYKKEIVFGETVKSSYAFYENKHVVYIYNADGAMNSIIQIW